MHDEYHEIDKPKTDFARKHTSNSAIWRKIIGKKIICSKCESKNPNAFNFMAGRGPHVLTIECMKCKHNGDYRPTQVEVSLFESAAKKIIEEQVEEKYGENPPISNIEVESVYRDDNFRRGRRDARKDETNYAIEA